MPAKMREAKIQTNPVVPPMPEAMAKLEADDVKRQSADFTLADLQGMIPRSQVPAG